MTWVHHDEELCSRRTAGEYERISSDEWRSQTVLLIFSLTCCHSIWPPVLTEVAPMYAEKTAEIAMYKLIYDYVNIYTYRWRHFKVTYRVSIQQLRALWRKSQSNYLDWASDRCQLLKIRQFAIQNAAENIWHQTKYSMVFKTLKWISASSGQLCSTIDSTHLIRFCRN